MKNRNNSSQTNVSKVRAQNNASAQNQPFAEEFASETDVAQVRKQNQKSEQNK